MPIEITVSGKDTPESRLQSSTRELLRDLKIHVDPSAELKKLPAEPNSRGEVFLIGQILMALVTGGAVTTLIQCLFGFLSRNRRLSIDLKSPEGGTLSLNVDYIDRHGIEHSEKLVKEFLERRKK